MKIVHPRIVLTALSGIAVIWLVSGHFEKRSPGPVTAVHGQLEAIAGGNDCSACHGGWLSSMTESCLDCHEVIATQIETSTGLHGRVASERVANCAMCHSEHHGVTFSMVNRQSFALAGVAGPEDFDHSFVGFEMAGKHLELSCAECHAHAEVAVLAPEQHRYLGLEQRCDACHDDPHEGRMSIGCAQCHSQESWDQLDSAGHDRFLPLLGGHADVSCRTCHAEDSPRSLEILGQGLDVAPRECAACHDSPHAGEFASAVAEMLAEPLGASCGSCHEADHVSFRSDSIPMTPDLHAASGFELRTPHEAVACADCHQPALEFAQRYPGRDADACVTCHEDPHDGQFDSGPFAAEGCIGCHDRHAFEPHAFTLRHHARTSLALTGQHAVLACKECHVDPPAGHARRFVDVEPRCDSCHDDAHTGFFERRFRALGAAPAAEVEPQGTCGHCHSTESFSESGLLAFEHGEWTGFAVEGAHAEARCVTCHPRTDEPDAHGRTFGRVEHHFGAFVGCETCHGDPHGGAFDRKAADQHGTGCARCHVETSFRVLPNGFDHREWTGFALLGAHGAASCSACHKPLAKAGPHGRTAARAIGTSCADCHDDPHAGQFASGRGTTDCASCHRTSDSFSDLRFDHDRHSNFRLGQAHADVACSACHKPEVIGGAEVTRYRPLPHECVDCHGSTRDPLRRRGRR